VTATYNGSNVAAYVDGVQINSTDASGKIGKSNNDVFIGAANTNSGLQNYYFNGTIDEVKIFDRALSEDEIKSIYIVNLERNNADMWNLVVNKNDLVNGEYTYYSGMYDFRRDYMQTEIRSITIFGAICGNGIIESYEQCDDGNTIDGDGCSHLCTSEVSDLICSLGTTCGDGIVQPDGLDGVSGTFDDEECDDGNRRSGDGCSVFCKKEICGDGIVQPKGLDGAWGIIGVDDDDNGIVDDKTEHGFGDDEECEPRWSILCDEDCKLI
jgi:cysteine-rich repeat protein